jgi:hypothetical protein
MKPFRAILFSLLIVSALSSFAQEELSISIDPKFDIMKTAKNVRMDREDNFPPGSDGRLVPVKLSAKLAMTSDFVNAVNVGYYGLPEALVGAKSMIASIEFERFVSSRASIAIRAEYLGYEYTEDESTYFETGSGTGAGLGFSYRKYFSEYGGFFLSPAVEFAIVNWDYQYRSTSSLNTDVGTGTSFAVAPNFVIGYRINIGEHFAITPSLMAGYRIGIGIEHEGEAIGGIGASASVRF